MLPKAGATIFEKINSFFRNFLSMSKKGYAMYLELRSVV